MLPGAGHVRSWSKGVGGRLDDEDRLGDQVIPGPIEPTCYQDLAIDQERRGRKLTGRGQLAGERRKGVGSGIVKYRVPANSRARAAATGDQNHAILKRRGGGSCPVLATSQRRSRGDRIGDRGCLQDGGVDVCDARLRRGDTVERKHVVGTPEDKSPGGELQPVKPGQRVLEGRRPSERG